MLSRVKKFRDKLFSSTRSRESSEDGTSSPTCGSQSGHSNVQDAAPSASHSSHGFFKRKDSSSQQQRHMTLEDTAKLTSPPDTRQTSAANVSRCSSNLGEGSSAQTALPVVQVNTAVTSVRDKALHTAAGTAHMLGSPSGSGRRKSTPAELDFALRSAEGRHAVEELLNHNNKKLVFGQYFAGNSSAAAAAAAASTAPLPPMPTIVTSARHGSGATPTATKSPSFISRFNANRGSQSLREEGLISSSIHHLMDHFGSASAGAHPRREPPSPQSATSPKLQSQGPNVFTNPQPGGSAEPGVPPAFHPSAPTLVAAVAAAQQGCSHPSHQLPQQAQASSGHHPPPLQAHHSQPLSQLNHQQPLQQQHSQPQLSQQQQQQQQHLHLQLQLYQQMSMAVPSAQQSRPSPSAPISAASGSSRAVPSAMPKPAAIVNGATKPVIDVKAAPSESAGSVTSPSATSAGPSPTVSAASSAHRVNKVVVLSPSLPAAMNRKAWALTDYNIVRKMYTGYASTVYQALCKRSLEMVALKVYHLENLCELNHYQVYREIRVHAALQHQNIIHLYAAFQEGSDVVLVQEYAEGGDLYRLLHKNGGRLHERQMVEMVLHPFLLALHYLHTNGIMHRDIKPENVLFTEQRVLKLADFGLAIDLNEERAVTRAGTLDYMAPEVLRCPPKNTPQENKNNPYLHYNNSVDAWAVGVFAFELVVGFPPFAGETQLDSVDKIMHSMPDFPEKITELAKDFICQALRKHPGDRPTVIEMLHHPWVRTYQRRTSVRLMDVRRQSYVSSHHTAVSAMQEGAAEGEDGTEESDDTHASTPVGPVVGGPGVGASQWPLGGGAVPSIMNPTVPDTGRRDIADMTPDEIDGMIRKLQAAKVTAIARGP